MYPLKDPTWPLKLPKSHGETARSYESGDFSWPCLTATVHVDSLNPLRAPACLWPESVFTGSGSDWTMVPGN